MSSDHGQYRNRGKGLRYRNILRKEHRHSRFSGDVLYKRANGTVGMILKIGVVMKTADEAGGKKQDY